MLKTPFDRLRVNGVYIEIIYFSVRAELVEARKVALCNRLFSSLKKVLARSVIPVKTGIQTCPCESREPCKTLDACFPAYHRQALPRNDIATQSHGGGKREG
jgi:hypothetical protein